MGTGDIDLRFSSPSSGPSTTAIVCAVIGLVALLIPPGVSVVAAMTGVGTSEKFGSGLAPLVAGLDAALPCGVVALIFGIFAVVGKAHAGWVSIVLGPLPIVWQVAFSSNSAGGVG